MGAKNNQTQPPKKIQIPRTLKEIAQIFEKQIETIDVFEQEYLKTTTIFGKKTILKETKNMRIVLDEEEKEYFVWIIETRKWNRKTYRNHFINMLQHALKIAILFFVPENTTENKILEEYAMTIITTDGYQDFPSIVPDNPNESAMKLWETIQKRKLDEDPFEFETSILQETTTINPAKILTSLKKNNIDNVLNIFEEAGHTVAENCILPKKDAIFQDLVLCISQHASKSTVRNALSTFKQQTTQEARWVIILTPSEIHYYENLQLLQQQTLSTTQNQKPKRRNKKEEQADLEKIKPVIAITNNRAAYNAEIFAQQYGQHSLLYFYAIKRLKNTFSQEKEKRINVLFKEWQQYFEKVYKKGDATEELFIKHTYLALLIRLVLFSTYFQRKQLEKKSIVELNTWLEKKGISMFSNDFFSWSENDLELIETLYTGLKPRKKKENEEEYYEKLFVADDVFRTIYQQMVSPETRHALGEFYTPQDLARLMVEETYQFGQPTLDPACGSGTFLVEIYRSIFSNTKKTKTEQINALNNVYGLDVNPIAVATSKANLLLLLKELIENNEKVSPQVFLTNSLFPLAKKEEPDSHIHYGTVIEFPLSSIGKKIYLSTEFFTKNNHSKLAKLLEQIDLLLSEDMHENQEPTLIQNFEEKIDKLLEKNEWLNQKIGNNQTLKTNIKDQVAMTFFKLALQGKNHIWSYLLHNSLGSFIIQSKPIKLIIGNPPWLVLNAVHNKEYKEKLKALAEKQKINPEPHQVTHLEMAALFLYKAQTYLDQKEGGKIAFVVSNAFLTGDNHARTRNFYKLKNIHVWKFKKDVFNIHNICLLATYDPNLEPPTRITLENLQVKVVTYKPELQKNGKYRFTIEGEPVIYEPYNVVEKSGKIFVKKLIPARDKQKILPLGENPYKNLCFNGATLFPRNLVFIRILDEFEENGVQYVKFKHVIENAKKPWDFDPLEKLGLEYGVVEKKYVFQAIKSTEIVPFLSLYAKQVFLPIEEDPETGGYRLTTDKKSKGWKYFQQLNKLYKKHIKQGASITDLWENLDYQGKLTAKRQRAPYKVVMMGSGTLVKSCVIKNRNIIIDYKNFLIGLNYENEAYYVSGFLNSPNLTRTIKIIQSEGAGGKGRDIQKRPFQIAFTRFNANNQLHMQIVKKIKEMEQQAIKITTGWVQSEKNKLTKDHNSNSQNIATQSEEISYEKIIKPMTIQNLIYRELGWNTKSHELREGSDYAELDALIRKLLLEESKTQSNEKAGLQVQAPLMSYDDELNLKSR